MKKLELFETALCCSTGVCGPSVDENLLRITADFEAINKTEGFEAKRYNLSNAPQAFIQNKKVSELLGKHGTDVLPIFICDGEVIKTSSYPNHDDLSQVTGIKFQEVRSK